MKRLWAVLLLLVTAIAVAGVAISLGPMPVEQPIAFNHRLHVEDLGSDCTDCHLYAETGVRATIPNVELCADCHSEAQTQSQEEAKLVEFIQAEKRIPWRKVYWVPDHVYFSHRRHTSIAGIECAACHGPIAQQEKPISRQSVAISMDRCMDCHYETGASNDCLLCHM